MTGSPRKGRKVSFEQDGATQGADPWDQVSALRFTIDPPYGGGVLVDFTTLRPRGLALAFARGAGEYGSVIFIAGNIPYVTEIAPLLIVIRLEEFNYGAATAIGALMLIISFVMLLVINLTQAWSRRRYGHG